MVNTKSNATNSLSPVSQKHYPNRECPLFSYIHHLRVFSIPRLISLIISSSLIIHPQFVVLLWLLKPGSYLLLALLLSSCRTKRDPFFFHVHFFFLNQLHRSWILNHLLAYPRSTFGHLVLFFPLRGIHMSVCLFNWSYSMASYLVQLLEPT